VRLICVVLIAAVLGSCALQRAQVAADAQTQMVGLTKEQLFACMGPPANKAAEGATEVWSYNSGNGFTSASISGGNSWATGVSTRRFCTVNITINDGRVSRVNYLGPTGGLLTGGEQCAFAVQNCAQ